MLPIAPVTTSGKAAAKPPANAIHFSPILAELARLEKSEVFTRMKTSPEGLSEADAKRRLVEAGPNVVASEKHRGWLWRLLTATRNPLVILLIVLAIISFATGDARAGTVMSLMVILGVSLRFVQEARADAAAAKLKAMITVTTAVVRAGKAEEIPLQATGARRHRDALRRRHDPGRRAPRCRERSLRLAGDADRRIAARGEIRCARDAGGRLAAGVRQYLLPRHQRGERRGDGGRRGHRRADLLRQHGEQHCRAKQVETSFDKGMQQFTWLMIRFMMVMVPLVFFINGFTKHNWHEAFFFSVAVAVGLTPEMLPMIVSVCLSKGALAMSQKKVIVKQLNSIQNFGAMDVLCTDKTGTLTMDQVILERHCDVMQKENDGVLLDAFLIAHFQTGLKNVLDRAVLRHRDAHEERHRWLSQGGRDPVRFRAPDDVGGRGESRTRITNS